MPFTMEIYTDGGCRGNGQPGAIGAAAAVFMKRGGRYNSRTRVLEKSPTPTNQRAEIEGIVLALETALYRYKRLRRSPYLEVTVYTDSRYAIGCMTDWIYKWTSNGWRNAAGYEVANRDLIERASNLDDQLKEEGEVKYVWIPRERNTIADGLCNDAMDNGYHGGACSDSSSDYY